jgi:hypothetical protein
MNVVPQSTSTRSLWKGIGQARIFERGNYVTGGFNGLVRVKRTIAKATRGSGLAFIVEMEVVTTNIPNIHPVGAKVTWFQKMVDLDIAYPAIKAWAAACVGLGIQQKAQIEEAFAGEVLEELMTYATDHEDSNEFVNILLHLETVMVKTKAGGDFTRYDFSPVDQNAA